MKITSIIKSEKKKDFYDIYTDGSFFISLPSDVLLDSSLGCGDELNESELLNLIKIAKIKACKKKAYDYLAYQDLSSNALILKLEKKGFESDIIDIVIDNLKENGVIDDTRYAKNLFKYYLFTKLFGPYRIKSELLKKCVDNETVSLLLEEYRDFDYTQNAKQVIITKYAKEDLLMEKSRAKVANALIRYGYDYESTKNALIEILEEQNGV